VLFRDASLVAVDKPSGLLVHRGWGHDRVCLVDLVRALAGAERVHPIHRLDRGTSGVVLLSLDAGLARRLQERWQTPRVQKRYLALVRGRPPEEGTIDHPLPRRDGGPRVPARTSFRRLATVDAEPRTVSLVEACPQTGRLHQVRRHLKHISHPVIGDANYGKGPLNREIAARYGLGRLALHAAALSFPHPVDDREVAIAAPLPDDLTAPLERLGFDPQVLLRDRR
jgi:tRNA pseudouridine65 synthase